MLLLFKLTGFPFPTLVNATMCGAQKPPGTVRIATVYDFHVTHMARYSQPQQEFVENVFFGVWDPLLWVLPEYGSL